MRGRSKPKRPQFGVLLAALAAPVLISEAVYFVAVRAATRLGPSPIAGRSAVVVLGVPGRSAGSRAVQRWRVAMAMRAWRNHRSARVVFTGGAVKTASTEAADMAAIARRLGLPNDAIVLEEHARTTRENVALVGPLVRDVDYVIIASDVLHATRAAKYWRDQYGSDAPRVVLADRYRPFDHFWLRLPTATFEALHYAQHRCRAARSIT